jgi:hypothetical protein
MVGLDKKKCLSLIIRKSSFSPLKHDAAVGSIYMRLHVIATRKETPRLWTPQN